MISKESILPLTPKIFTQTLNVWLGLLVVATSLAITLFLGTDPEGFYIKTEDPSPFAPIKQIFDVWSLVLVMGGTIGSTMIAFPLHRLGSAFRSLIIEWSTNFNEEREVIYRSALYFSEQRRLREAIHIGEDQKLNPFMAEWIALFLTEGREEASHEKINDIISMEIDMVKMRAEEDIEVFDFMAQTSPAFGVVGTVIGLAILFSSGIDLQNIKELLLPMSIALLTTLYGLLLANVVFEPAISKRTQLKNENCLSLEMTREAILHLKARTHKNDIADYLQIYLPVKTQRELRYELTWSIKKKHHLDTTIRND